MKNLTQLMESFGRRRIRGLILDPEAREKIEKTIEQVSKVAFYVVTNEAPFWIVHYDPIRGYYILHEEMLQQFLDSMAAAGMKMIRLDENNILDTILPEGSPARRGR